MSFTTLDMVMTLWKRWKVDIKDSKDGFFSAATGKLPSLAGINLPMVVGHPRKTWIFMINFT